jgi:hypothetical protein
MDGHMDGWIHMNMIWMDDDGWMMEDGWMDGWMDG